MANDAVQRGPARAVRATVLGASAVGLAAAAHVAGGGSVPGAATLALLAVPVAWVSVALARRRRGPMVIGTALLALQIVLHHAFMTLAGMGCAPSGAGGGLLGHVGHGGATGALAACAAPTGTEAGVTAAVALPSGLMAGTHLLATLGTALLLARAERIASTLGGLLALVASRLRASLVPYLAPWSAEPLPAPDPDRPRRTVFVRSTGRRGPPLRPARPRPLRPWPTSASPHYV